MLMLIAQIIRGFIRKVHVVIKEMVEYVIGAKLSHVRNEYRHRGTSSLINPAPFSTRQPYKQQNRHLPLLHYSCVQPP